MLLFAGVDEVDFCFETFVMIFTHFHNAAKHTFAYGLGNLYPMFYMFPFQNNSNKAVKKIKVSVRQFADICLFSTAQYKCTVDEKVNRDRDSNFCKEQWEINSICAFKGV